MEPLTFPAANAVRIDVAVSDGDVRVKQTSGDSIDVQVTGEHDPDDVSVDSTADNDGVLHITIAERHRRGIGWKPRRGIRVDISSPTSTHLVVEGGSIDLRADAPLASVRFSSGSGDARLETVDGNVDVKVASGDLKAATIRGALRAHSASGDVAVGAVGEGAVVRTASGDISIDAVAGTSSITTLSGDVELDTVHEGSLSVQAVSGDVTIGLAAGMSCMLDVSSLSGETHSDLGVTASPVAGDAPQLDLKVNTVTGDVRIRRGSKDLLV